MSLGLAPNVTGLHGTCRRLPVVQSRKHTSLRAPTRAIAEVEWSAPPSPPKARARGLLYGGGLVADALKIFKIWVSPIESRATSRWALDVLESVSLSCSQYDMSAFLCCAIPSNATSNPSHLPPPKQASVPEGTPVVPTLDLPSRPRRNRRSPSIRRAFSETVLRPDNLILPVFIHDGEANIPIDSMPGVSRLGWKSGLLEEVTRARSYGVNSVVLFPKVSGRVGIECATAHHMVANGGAIQGRCAAGQLPYACWGNGLLVVTWVLSLGRDTPVVAPSKLSTHPTLSSRADPRTSEDADRGRELQPGRPRPAQHPPAQGQVPQPGGVHRRGAGPLQLRRPRRHRAR